MESIQSVFQREYPVEKDLCFILMPFRKGIDEIYHRVIKPTVIKRPLNMKCVRADEIYTDKPIMGDIWEYIQKAEIVIADLTGKNPNVLYELGLCHSLWKRVVLISQSIDDVPFDLRHFRVIIYEHTLDGAKVLGKELGKVIIELRQNTKQHQATLGQKAAVEYHQLAQSGLAGQSDTHTNIEELRQGILTIAKKLRQKNFRPEVIVSFNRSGTALAGMCAVNMKIDEILTISRRRDKSNNPSATAKRKYVVGELLNLNATKLRNKKILAVMMLFETGDTIEDGLQFLRREGLTQDIAIAAMYITSGARNRWPNVVFAYETNEPKNVLEKLPWVDKYDFV